MEKGRREKGGERQRERESWGEVGKRVGERERRGRE